MAKEITIDGVDVSRCVSFDKLNGLNICCYSDTREDEIPFANFCVENKDCHFKQLKRKEQALDEIEEFCIVYSNNHDAYETVYKHILDIINKAKEKNNG